MARVVLWHSCLVYVEVGPRGKLRWSYSSVFFRLVKMHFSTAVTLLASLASQAMAVAPLVDLNYTSYQGVPLSNNVTSWLGIRYARPPVGNLRFSAPQDPVGNGSVQLANAVSGCDTVTTVYSS